MRTFSRASSHVRHVGESPHLRGQPFLTQPVKALYGPLNYDISGTSGWISLIFVAISDNFWSSTKKHLKNFSRNVPIAIFLHFEDFPSNFSQLQDTDPSPDYLPDAEDEDDDDDVRCNNLDHYPQTARTALRVGVSPFAVSLLLNSMLADQGVTDQSKYINVKKIKRELEQIGLQLELEHDQIKGYEYLGVDSKKTDVCIEKNQTEKIDNQTIICQGRRQYAGHIPLRISTGAAIAAGIYKVQMQ